MNFGLFTDIHTSSPSHLVRKWSTFLKQCAWIKKGYLNLQGGTISKGFNLGKCWSHFRHALELWSHYTHLIRQNKRTLIQKNILRRIWMGQDDEWGSFKTTQPSWTHFLCCSELNYFKSLLLLYREGFVLFCCFGFAQNRWKVLQKPHHSEKHTGILWTIFEHAN